MVAGCHEPRHRQIDQSTFGGDIDRGTRFGTRILFRSSFGRLPVDAVRDARVSFFHWPDFARQDPRSFRPHLRGCRAWWITTLLSPEETATQAKTLFLRALELEGLIESVEDRLETGELPDSDEIPILLAVSDNGSPMQAGTTKAFMALRSIDHRIRIHSATATPRAAAARR
jgi:hypothetical protein